MHQSARKVTPISDDGCTRVFIKNNRKYTVACATDGGFYPAGSRAAAYKGGTDRRHSQSTIDMVQEARAAGRMSRHVHPGQQSWS